MRDPICGMDVDEAVARKKGLVSVKGEKTYYFCNSSCKKKFENPWYKGEKFGLIFPYVLGFVLIVGTVLSVVFDFMVLYMGVFFIVFSLFKMPDWKGFVKAFSQYDLIARRSRAYAWAYPVIEFGLGVLFILSEYVSSILLPVTWVTLGVMVIGSIGVGLKLLKKEKFQCACLGTWINVPLTKVTLLEDLLMVVMAVMLLVRFLN